MSQFSEPIFKRPEKSKALPIINPVSGERLPTPMVQKQPARIFPGPIDPPTTNRPAIIFTQSIPTNAKYPLKPERKNNDLEELALNVYARPFVPESLATINELNGLYFPTPAIKPIDFGAYAANAIPFHLLPLLPNSFQPPINVSFTLDDNTGKSHYEGYFRYHLEAEIESQKRENDSCSLFGHDVTVSFDDTGQSICSFIVPGLRENRPYIEEDAIVQLRQLHYDPSGNLIGMKEWLSPIAQYHGGSIPSSHALGGRWKGEPAPGWTGFFYNARVLAVRRKEEELLVRVYAPRQCLPLQNNPAKFNVQFPISIERYFPMQQVLPIIQKALAGRDQSLNQAVSQVFPPNWLGFANSKVVPQTCYQWISSMLFPSEVDCERQTTLNPGSFGRFFFDKQLNWEQKKAIESIASQNYGTLPYLISGPPGTGKTKTLVEVALQLLKRVDDVSHIIFCAPSDPAADTILQRISSNFTQSELLRLNRSSRTFAEVPSSVLPFCYTSQVKFDLPPFAQLMSYKLIVTTCRDASLLLYSRMTNTDLYAAENGLRALTHPSSTRQSQEAFHWTALIIDEAAQAMEPEALIPLSVVAPPLKPANLAFVPLLIMAGDEYQLGPRTSLSSSPLKTSLFARLFSRPVYADHPLARGRNGTAPRPLNKGMLPIARPAFTNLIRNYRSHPAILAVPSALYYHDTPVPETVDINRLAAWPHWRGKRWPVLFYNNVSEDEQELNGGGWYNKGEATIACEYAALLVQSKLVQQNEICIMSPFKAQVQCLRKSIRESKYGGLWSVDIGPMEAFQGLEREVVILCTTRSKKRFVENDIGIDQGIIGLPNKMNVALTRAKFGLIVIGKKETLLEDPNWKAFMEFCTRNGLVAGAGSSWQSQHDFGVKPTRIENGLLAKEQALHDDRVLDGNFQDDEMLTQGMQATFGAQGADACGDEHEDEAF